MKKKEILFIITAIFILMIITAYYVAFVKPKNINFDQPNIEISEEDDNENIEEKPPIIEEPEEPTQDEEDDIYTESEFINKYKWLGYKEVEIPSEMPEFKQQEVKKIEIDETKEDHYSDDDTICNMIFHNNLLRTCVNIEVENNKAYFIFNDQKLKIPINDIKKVYISRYYFQSEDEFIIYFLTNAGDVYELYQGEGEKRSIQSFINEDIDNMEKLNQEIIERLKNSFDKIKKINNQIKYKELFILEYYSYFSIWGFINYVGIDYNNEIYLLDNEMKLTEDLYAYSQYCLLGYQYIIYLVDLNGNIILNGNNTNIKYKFSINGLIISDKNIIYEIIDGDEIKLNEIGKLKLLYANKKEEKIAVLLDNGKILEY